MDEKNKDILEQAQSIMDRLEETYKQQGLTMTIDRLEGQLLMINVERFAHGAPTAFMVKALGGTFRRYLPAIQQVGVNSFSSSVKSERDCEASSPSPLFTFSGLPEIDMSEVNAQEAVVALDNFAELIRRHNLSRFRVSWKGNSEMGSLLSRWVNAREDACVHPQGDHNNIFIVHIPSIDLTSQSDIHCGVNEVGEVLPARLMLTMPKMSEEKE